VRTISTLSLARTRGRAPPVKHQTQDKRRWHKPRGMVQENRRMAIATRRPDNIEMFARVTSVKVVYDASSGLPDYAAFLLGASAFGSACSSSRLSRVM